jgi:DNA-binding transcriptional MerR regulator
MANYSSADAERLLNIKSHILRYWVEEMPLIQPKKDISGRRQYSGRDLRILLRLKYLIQERRLNMENAREQLEQELSGIGRQNLRAELDAVRSELVDLYFSLTGKS